MATVRKSKKRTVKSLDAAKAREKTEQRRKPFPPLPKNADGTVSAKYLSAVVVDIGKQSLPPEGMFSDWLHYWQTARDFYASKYEHAEKRVDELEGLTAEEREERRTGVKAHERAVKSVQDETTQQVFASAVLEDPTLLTGKMTAAQLLQLQAQLQAALTAAQTATE